MGCTENEAELMVKEWIEFRKAQSWTYSTEETQKWIPLLMPQHSVFLSKFNIAKFPITNQEFRIFWQNGGYEEERWWNPAGIAWLNRSTEDEEKMSLEKWQRRNDRTEPAFWNDPKLSIPNRPIVGVTWFEAMAYCTWLSEQLQLSGELPYGYVVRLPTEAEWEKAARGTDGRLWPWGNEWKDGYTNTNEANWLTTSSVGVFYADVSHYGAFDLVGNIREWCHSLLAEYPYNPRDGRENIDTDGRRVARGGYWVRGRYSTRCAYRRRYLQDVHHDGLGFRVVVGPKLD